MDNGIGVSNTQAILALTFLVGTIGTLLGIIRSLYADASKTLREEVEDLKEELKAERAKNQRIVENLERAVDLLDRQQGIAETEIKSRRRTGGDD